MYALKREKIDPEWDPNAAATADAERETEQFADAQDPGQQIQISKASAWMVMALVASTVALATIAGTTTGIKGGFLLKNGLHLSAGQASTLGIIMGIPAYLRPLFGVGADLFPLFGYHRKSYYVLGWILSAASSIALGLAHSYTVANVVELSILGGVGGVLIMVMADAVMVAVGNQTGNVGRYQSVQQVLPVLMSIFGLSQLGGYLAQVWSYNRCFLVAGLISLLGVFLVFFIPEARSDPNKQAHETAAEHEARLKRKRVERDRTKRALVDAARTPGLWAMVIYIFYLILTPGVGTPQFYFSTNVLHFSPRFLGILGAWGSGGSIVGALIFAVISRRLPVQSMVWGAFLMDCAAYPLNFLLHNHPTGILISFIGGMTGIIYALCLYTLAARACPAGTEGTIYGLVISAIALAGGLGDKLGSSIYEHFGPATHHSVTYGWYALNAIGFVFTLLASALIPFLPAWSKSNEPLTPPSNTVKTAT